MMMTVQVSSNNRVEGDAALGQRFLQRNREHEMPGTTLEDASLEAQLRLALSASNIGLFDWDFATNRVKYSREWKSQIGYAENEITDDFSEWQSRCHPDDLDRVLARVRDYIANPNQAYENEFRFRHRDGRWLWILTRAEIVRDEHDVPSRLIGCHIDVTAQKHAEESLRRSEAYYRSIIEATPDGIAIVDTSFRFRNVNEAFSLMLGWSREELLTMTVADMVDPAEAGRIAAEAARLDLDPVVRSEWTFRRADGSRFPADVHATKLADGNMLGVIRDITARVASDERIRKSEAGLAEAQSLAHFGSWEMDPATGASDWSEEMYRLFRRDSALGPPSLAEFLELLHPDDRQRVIDFSAGLEQGPHSRTLEYRTNEALGPSRDLVLSLHITREDTGALRSFGTVQDITEQKAEAAAREKNAETIKLIVDVANVGLWDWNIRANEVYLSPEWKGQLGYQDEELPNRLETWKERVHPSDLDVLLRSRDSASGQAEYRLRHRDGSWRWILSRSTTIRDDEGNPIRMMGCHVDITERKDAEAAREAAEQRTRLLIESSNIGLWERDLVTGQAYFSPEWKRNIGLEDEEMANTFEAWSERIVPEDRERVLAFSRAFAEGGNDTGAIQYRMMHKDGSTRHVESRSLLFRDDTGKPQRMLGCHIDLTDRVHAEEERRQIYERISDGVVALDKEWRFTYLNPKAEELMGQTLIGRNMWEEFPSVVPTLLPPFEEAMSTQTPRTIEHFSVLRDRWFELRIHPAPNGLSMYYHDITERRAAAEAIQKSEQRLRNLIDGLGPSMFVGMLAPDGTLIDVNAPALDAANTTRAMVIGRRFDELECWTYSKEVQSGVREAIEWALLGRSSRYDVVARVGREKFIVVDFSLQPVFDVAGEVTCLIPSARVITDRKRAEDALQEANDRLRALSHRQLTIQEEERRQLARELHDEIGQELTAIKMGLETLKRFPDSLPSTVDATIGIVDQTLQQVRALSLHLRPPMLDDLGLGPSVRWLVDQQGALTQTRIRFHDALQRKRFDPAIETACFRIAQEALTNIVRHAHAANAVAHVEERDGGIVLTVSDDGRGFDVPHVLERAAHGASFGLLSMRERASLAGGTITWKSEPGTRTEVRAWLPCRYTEE